MPDQQNQVLFEENQEILKYLEDSRLFGHLPKEIIQKLVPLSELVQYPGGTAILKEGQQNDKVYFLIRGEVDVYVQEEWIITLQRTGDIFGEMSIISNKPCFASVITKTPVNLFTLRSRDVGRYSDLNAEELQNILYHLFAMILTDKLAFTTHKAKQFETTNQRLDQTKEVLQQAYEELGQQLKVLQKTTVSRDFFNNVIQSMMGTLIVTAPDNTIQMINQSTLDLLEYEQEELIGKSIKTILADEEFFKEASIDDLPSIGSIAYVEAIYLAKNGRKIPMLFSGSVIRDEEGNPQGAVCNALDITERKQAEKERRHLEAQLRHSQKMEALGTLAGGIAHDFNNLLTPITGFTHLLQKKVHPKSKEFGFLQTVANSANRAKDLISQILILSRKTEPNTELVHLELITENVLESLPATIPAMITVIKEIKSDISPIMADATQIHQVMTNLCMNAIHAMPEEGTLTINLANVENYQFTNSAGIIAQGNFLCLSVKDTGHGMDQQTLEHIFDPFFTTKEKGEQRGTGLGLAVVLGIVESHRGHIEVESEVGQGTTFRVYLPVQESEETPSKKVTPSLLSGEENILFVDDERMNIEVTTILLEDLGYLVTSLTDSREALETFCSQPQHFDLIITDYNMPYMTGVTLSKKIKEIRPDIPIILCSGYTTMVSREKLQDWSIDALIIKPFEQEELSQIVRSVLDEKKK